MSNVSICLVPLTATLRASGHPGLQMTSEVKFDIRNPLMGINDLSSHVFPASEYLYGLNDTPEDKWLP